MKGTKLWQGPGSPLIQGKSRQIRPLWQPWLVGFVLSMLISNATAWYLFATFPPEFFFLGSALGGLLGARVAQAMGWKARWILGTCTALVINALVYAACMRWAPSLMWHFGRG